MEVGYGPGMAHVAVAARLESLAARDRQTAESLQLLADSTGCCDDAMAAIISAHLRLAMELEAVASRNRESDI